MHSTRFVQQKFFQKFYTFLNKKQFYKNIEAQNGQKKKDKFKSRIKAHSDFFTFFYFSFKRIK